MKGPPFLLVIFWFVFARANKECQAAIIPASISAVSGVSICPRLNSDSSAILRMDGVSWPRLFLDLCWTCSSCELSAGGGMVYTFFFCPPTQHIITCMSQGVNLNQLHSSLSILGCVSSCIITYHTYLLLCCLRVVHHLKTFCAD